MPSKVIDNLLSEALSPGVTKRILKGLKMRPLSCVEQEQVSVGLGRRDGGVAITKFRIEMTFENLACLRDRTWLNDEVVNFHMEMLTERLVSRKTLPNLNPLNCAFFNTFFFTKLTGGTSGLSYDYKSVQRWTKRAKLDIFALDLLFIPINLNNVHWVLGVVNFKEKRLEYFDSMHGSDRGFFTVMEKYLQDEFQDKKSDTFDFGDWSTVLRTDCPTQQNGYDCGMFVCKFTDYLSDGLDLDFSSQDMVFFRERLYADILQGSIP